MPLLIMDSQSALLMEVSVGDIMAETLIIQWGRLPDEVARSAFAARFAPRLELALGESFDWDLKTPTPAQVTYATGISRLLGVALTSEVLRYRGPMNEFLDRHAQAFKDQGIGKRRTGD